MQAAEVHALAGAYALDAVDDLERAAFERHLAECEVCRDESRGLREVMVRLAEGVRVPPPRRVRGRVLDRVSMMPQLPPRATVRAVEPRRRTPRVLVAASVVLLAAAAGVGVVAGIEKRDADRAMAYAAAISSVVSDPAARTVHGAVTGGGSAAVVVAQGRAVLAASSMPALPADRAYQLWIVRPERVSSAGLGPAAGQAAGSWTRLVDGVRKGDVVAISVEPAAGSQQPTTKPVATLKI